MVNYFEPALTDDELRAISSIGLAHMGDAVFEILVRTWLCAHGKATGKGLHQATIRLVCAESQSQKAQKILPLLSEEELAVFKRGRPGPFYSCPCQPCPVRRGHGAGGAAGLAVSERPERADQRTVL